MKSIYINQTSVEILEKVYANMTDLDAEWPVTELRLAVSVGSSARDKSDRHAIIAAKALDTLDPINRDEFETVNAIPPVVRSVDPATVPWPDPRSIPTYAGSLGMTLEKAQGMAARQINKEIDRARRLFITPIIGQDMIYKEKETEAARYLALETEPTDLTDFPFLAAEVGKTAPTAIEVAQVYLNLSAQWRQVGSALEEIRIGHLVAIEAAQDVDEVSAQITSARSAVDATLGALSIA